VRSVLGVPQSTRQWRDDDSHDLVVWSYRGLTVSFDRSGHGYSWHLTARRYATLRGVRPGDSAARVTAAYGAPSVRGSKNLLYPLRPNDDANTLGIDFLLSGGAIRSISIGNVISVE
jgi:hypothetical protein